MGMGITARHAPGLAESVDTRAVDPYAVTIQPVRDGCGGHGHRLERLNGSRQHNTKVSDIKVDAVILRAAASLSSAHGRSYMPENRHLERGAPIWNAFKRDGRTADGVGQCRWAPAWNALNLDWRAAAESGTSRAPGRIRTCAPASEERSVGFGDRWQVLVGPGFDGLHAFAVVD